MKKLFLAALVTVVTSLSAFAQKEPRLLVHAGQFTHLEIGENMNVVLLQAEADESMFNVSKELTQSLDISLSSNSLHIAPQDHFSKTAVVYIVVSDLEKLTLGRDTKVQTQGHLNLGKLEMYLNEGCLVTMNTNAVVKAYSLGEHDVLVKKFNAASPVAKIF